MIEEAEAGDHQSIRLARQRCREQRMTFGVAREALREGDQFLTVFRRRPVRLGHVGDPLFCRDWRVGATSTTDYNRRTARQLMPRTRTLWTTTATIVLALIAFAGAWALTPPRGPRSLRQFDAERLADLEVGMWQAYYAKEQLALFRLLVTMLHEQYHYSWATAAREGFHLARAAARFGDLRCGDGGPSDPCRPPAPAVLPDLEIAYAEARSWLDARFDPRAVARAELAWWVARRRPGQDSPEQVARLMAEEYSLLYEAPVEQVYPAALLRAEAGAMRDAQASNPDWDAIRSVLRQSYRELLAGFSVQNA